MGRFGKAGVVVVALIVAGVAVAIVAGGGGDDGGKTGIGTRTEARNPPETTTASAPRTARKRRQKVKHGHGTQPDRPAPGTGALLAIADQKPETFSDPLFRALGVARSRLNTPWNSIYTEPDRLGAWLAAARGAGVEPLVAFQHARGDQCPAEPCRLPSVAAYTKAIAAFHRAY